MSEYPQTPEPSQNKPLPPLPPPPDDRHRMKMASNPGWVVGLIVVLVGVVMLLNNFGSLHLNNWWALFILIPAIGSFTTAYNFYRHQGRFSASVRGSLIGGVVLTFITIVFLFSLDFGQMWPVFLIVAGVAILLNGILPD